VADGINNLQGKVEKTDHSYKEGFTGCREAYRAHQQQGSRQAKKATTLETDEKGESMRTTLLTVGALALSLLGTGCVATHKYVAKTVAPVEQRVSSTEAKNTEQDKQLTTHTGEISDLDKDLSQTKERLRDTDSKATQAGEAAKTADQHAGAAQQAANGAKQAADGARTFAEQGLTKLDQSTQENMRAMNKFQVLKTDNILFDFNKDTLTAEGKAQLDDLAHQAMGLDRYVIELQGFTDKSGSAMYNATLSEARVQAVARYLANQYQVPVRNISMLGAGYARPVADDKTREGRKANRRVEVRLWVPESQGKTVASSGN
jgi:outer membrane protein OmpA-like peptidoglycan-associated protein